MLQDRPPVRIERGDEVFELKSKPKKMRIEDAPDRPWIAAEGWDDPNLPPAWEWNPDGGRLDDDLP